jgi:tetratricopeptide (TPR) repeat protein
VSSRTLLSALAVALLATPLAADTIKLQNGSAIEGVKVLKESYAEISYRKPHVNAPQSVASSDVARVEYSSTSAEYREALTKLDEGSPLEAAENFYAAAENEDSPPYLRASAMIQAADLLLEIRQIVDALPLYEEALANWPDTRHLAAALLGRGKCLLFLGKTADAEAAFAKLLSESKEKSLGERWEMEGAYYALLVSESKAPSKKVLEQSEVLRKRAGVGWPGIANKCALRIGRVQLDSGDARQAMSLFEEIIDGRLDTDKDIVAAAFNGRGHCHFEIAQAYVASADKYAASGESDKAGVAREDALDSYRKARLDFLRVVVSYSHVLDQQAEALYWSAQCFLNVDDEDAQRQAGRLLRKCELEYPDSKWGKLAGQH